MGRGLLDHAAVDRRQLAVAVPAVPSALSLQSGHHASDPVVAAPSSRGQTTTPGFRPIRAARCTCHRPFRPNTLKRGPDTTYDLSLYRWGLTAGPRSRPNFRSLIRCSPMERFVVPIGRLRDRCQWIHDRHWRTVRDLAPSFLAPHDDLPARHHRLDQRRPARSRGALRRPLGLAWWDTALVFTHFPLAHCAIVFVHVLLKLVVIW